MTNVYTTYEPPRSGQGLYLKLEDGEVVKARIASDPYIFNNNYKGQISTRYGWVVYNYGEDRAQIFQQGVTGYRTIANLAADSDWGDPKGFDIRISREGIGTDTKYHITPLPNKAPLTAEQLAKVKEINFTEKVSGAILLSDAAAGKEVPQADNAPAMTDDEFESLLDGAPF